MKKEIFSFVLITSVLLNSIPVFAHAGGVDKNGGHKDNKNVSGLGSYHYHCGSSPAHLHTDGICPYADGNNYEIRDSNFQDETKIHEMKEKYWAYETEARALLDEINLYEKEYDKLYEEAKALDGAVAKLGNPPTYSFSSAREKLDISENLSDYESVLRSQLNTIERNINDVNQSFGNYKLKNYEYITKFDQYKYEINNQTYVNRYQTEPEKTENIKVEQPALQTDPIVKKEESTPKNSEKYINDTENIMIVVNNKILGMDQFPIIQEDSIFMPIRVVGESIGAEVFYDEAAKTVILTRDNNVIKLTIGSNVAYINSKAINIEKAPRIINNRAMIPLRFVAENMDLEVTWDGEEKIAYLVDKN